MKKVIFLLCCTAAQLGHAAPFTGFYLTGAIGGTNGQFDTSQNTEANLPALPVDLILPSEIDLTANNVAGLLAIGYSYQFANQFVLGLALEAGYTNITASNNAHLAVLNGMPNIFLDSHIESTLTNDFSLLFKPGYVFNQSTLFYGLIGPRWGNFKTSTSVDFSLVGDGLDLSFPYSDSVSGYEIGLTAGLGIQQNIVDHFHLGLEYVYTTYGNIDTPNASGDAGTLGTLTDSPNAKVTTNTVMLGLTYQW